MEVKKPLLLRNRLLSALVARITQAQAPRKLSLVTEMMTQTTRSLEWVPAARVASCRLWAVALVETLAEGLAHLEAVAAKGATKARVKVQQSKRLTTLMPYLMVWLGRKKKRRHRHHRQRLLQSIYPLVRLEKTRMMAGTISISVRTRVAQ